MKKIKNRSFNFPIAIAIFVLALFPSCIDDVDDINLPKVDPKLVIQSFISPNDSILITISASRPMNYNIPITGGWDSDNHVIVTDATVTIRNNQTNTEVLLPFNGLTGKYGIASDEFLIEAGVAYTLFVSAPGYKPVSASTRVPEFMPEISPIEFDTISNNEYGERTIIMSAQISDIPNQENFYSVMLYQVSTYDWSGFNETYLDFASQDMISDSGKDGEEIGFKLEYWDYYSEYRKTYIFVHAADEHYYHFFKSLESVEDFESNPFAESSILYSNIEGGLGIFASFLPVVTIVLE